MSRITILWVIVLGVLISLAAGQDNRNAATWYQRAAEHGSKITEADWQLIYDYRDNPSKEPSPELRAALARADQFINLAVRGAQQPFADYRLDYEQGFEMLLPHLAPLRQMARVMQADALVKLYDGNAAGAAERMASVYSMSSHLTSDRVLISSLVGQAIFGASDAAVQIALDQGRLTPSEAAKVLSSLKDLPLKDPFGYVECMAMEHELGIATIQRFIGEEGDDRVGRLAEFLGAEEEVPAALRDMSQEQLEGEVAKYDAMMSRVTEAFALDDPETAKAALKQINEDIATGEHGVFVQLLMPSFDKLLERKLESEEKLAARIQTLTAIAQGELDPLVEANAAIWYMRAAAVVRNLSSEQLLALRNWDASPSVTIEQSHSRVIEKASGALDYIRTAQLMKRCDFALARDANPTEPELAPVYAAELRDLIRYLMLDLAMRIHLDQREHLYERFQIILTMLAHIDGDPVFAVASMTHDAFNRVVAIVCKAHDRGQIAVEQRDALFSVADRLSRKDPFGYIAASIRAKTLLASRFVQPGMWQTEEGRNASRLVEQRVLALPAPDVLFIAIALTELGADESRREAVRAAIEPMLDLFDASALAGTRGMMNEARPLIAAADIDGIRRLSAPDVMQLDRRMRSARTDLRDAFKALRPTHMEPHEPASAESGDAKPSG